MTSQYSDVYPRPDFQRPNPKWQSLNGLWSFIFDDLDVGISESWQQSGLPAETASVVGEQSENDANNASSITQKIAALPDALLKDNIVKPNWEIKKNARCDIQVPFVFQSQASGVNNQDAHEVLWYERTIHDPRISEDFSQGQRVLLRFGAVDYEATIWIDGAVAGDHRGGHVPFDIDITPFLKSSSARITIRVRDSPYALTQPRGKQYWGPKPESIFYTPSSGIWQNVWLEVVPATRIADSSHGTILRSDDITNGLLKTTIVVHGSQVQTPLKVGIEVSLAGCTVSKKHALLPKEARRVNLDIEMRVMEEDLSTLSTILKLSNNKLSWYNGVALWSPDHPTLYDVTISLFDTSDKILDQIRTTTGMRSIEWMTGDNTFRINGEPIFQALVLDQGYWPNTNMTPPSSESLKADIELSQQMGFNGCRKHQKVEDPIFLYWADRLGYLVWGEAANAYEFNDEYVEIFDQEWRESVKRDINHPCIVTWTPVNESWGYTALENNVQQRDHIRSLYYTTRTLDTSRPINDNCGWQHVCNDLTTFHEYADSPVLKNVCASMEGILGPKAGIDLFVKALDKDPGIHHRVGAPILCTEFGGVNIASAQGEQGGERDWGYTTATNPEDLLRRVEALIMAVVDGGLCCGFVYTQLTDIEQEVNGLYTFDRRPKLDVTMVKAIMDKAKSKYFELLGKKG